MHSRLLDPVDVTSKGKVSESISKSVIESVGKGERERGGDFGKCYAYLNTPLELCGQLGVLLHEQALLLLVEAPQLSQYILVLLQTK